MAEDDIMPFERQFDETPTRIGRVIFAATDELAVVHIHRGMVDVPIYPPEGAEDDVDIALNPFLLELTPADARNLAGLLIYAAGRAEETGGDRCSGCDRPLDDHDDDDGEPLDDADE